MSASSGSPAYINSYIKRTQTGLCHIVTCQFRQWNSSAWILTHSPSYIQYITRNEGYIYEQYNFIKFILLCLWKNKKIYHIISPTQLIFFMVAPCNNNIKFLFVQLMHTNYKTNETPTWCNTMQVLFLQCHSKCFGRKCPSSGVFKTGTAATGTCVIVAGKSSHLLIRAGSPFRP